MSKNDKKSCPRYLPAHGQLRILIWKIRSTLIHNEYLHWKLGIFIFPIVSFRHCTRLLHNRIYCQFSFFRKMFWIGWQTLPWYLSSNTLRYEIEIIFYVSMEFDFVNHMVMNSKWSSNLFYFLVYSTS